MMALSAATQGSSLPLPLVLEPRTQQLPTSSSSIAASRARQGGQHAPYCARAIGGLLCIAGVRAARTRVARRSVQFLAGRGAVSTNLRGDQRWRVARAAEALHPPADEVTFLKDVFHEVKELVVLQQAEEDVLGKLAAATYEVQRNAGDAIVQQGELSQKMYIVASGEVNLVRVWESSGNEERKTKMAARGFYFGAESMLGNTPQKMAATAVTDCKLWCLERQVFDNLVLGAAKEDEDEDDEDSDDVCETKNVKEIFVVSDSTGESASASVYTAMRQFDYCFNKTCGVSRTTVFRFVRTAEEATRISELARKRNALLVHTVMEPKVHSALIAACKERDVECCDLWEPLLQSLERKFDAKRSGIFGRKQAVGENYMKIVKAIEYTRKVDDGVLPNMWNDCDIMLVGPSRAGKTPLAFYLAQRGFKVANYPLVPDEEPPKELFSIDQAKCFALMIQPERLRDIRMERMRKLGMGSNTSYARLDEVKKEVSWMKTFYMRKGPKWPVIDTTNAGVVETASRILEILDRRKGDSLAAATALE